MHKLQMMLIAARFTPRGYSGRGMFGKKCLAVPATGLGQVTAGLIRQALLSDKEPEDVADEVIKAISGVRMDNLGTDMIVYFPEVEYAHPEKLDLNWCDGNPACECPKCHALR